MDMKKKPNKRSSFTTAKPQYVKTFKKVSVGQPVGTKPAGSTGKTQFVGIQNLT